MNRSWHFGDLEFVVLWEQLTGDFLPHPLAFTSRTPLYHDYQREKQETATRAQRRLDAQLFRAFESLAFPDVRVAVQGWDPRCPERAGGWIRILAGRRGDYGCVAIQQPGESPRHSGGFVVLDCDALTLADSVIAALPKADPGEQGDIALSVILDDDDHTFGTSPVGASSGDNAGRARLLLRNLPECMGTIDITQGASRFGPRGITTHRIEWRDIRCDGRYAIAHTAPWAALSADADRLRAMVNTQIADIILAIRDERS